jgi:hypothetical protein
MGLRDKLAAVREQNREAAEVARASQRLYEKSDHLRALGVLKGEPDPALTEADLDAMIEAEERRLADLYETFTAAGTVITFTALGVQVLQGGDQVYTLGVHDHYAKTNSSRVLGPLAGARAVVTDGTQAFSLGKAALMPLATAPLARKETADAMVTFADGMVHSCPLDGSHAVRDARRQCVEFNALAGAAAGPSAPRADDAAGRLRQLAELLDEGLVSQAEYDRKRAAIIDSI